MSRFDAVLNPGLTSGSSAPTAQQATAPPATSGPGGDASVSPDALSACATAAHQIAGELNAAMGPLCTTTQFITDTFRASQLQAAVEEAQQSWQSRVHALASTTDSQADTLESSAQAWQHADTRAAQPAAPQVV